ncbi:MAG: alpha/beta fold hydrolase [Acidobacteriia bacterium]|nr:alpha/beta fold hydrolase [Terriglobia bacterium]
MPRLLFAGSDFILDSYMAAESLLQPSTSVCILLKREDSHLKEEIQHFVCGILQETMQKEPAEAACGNLIVTAAESDDPADMARTIREFDAQQVWFTPAVRSARIGPDAQSHLARLLSALRSSPIKYFNYVAPCAVNNQFVDQGRGEQNDFESSRAAQFQSSQLPFRLFHIPLIVGEYLSSRMPTGHPFLLFLAELNQLKREIEERYLDYFEYQSLRCPAPANSHLNLIHVREVARTLLRISSDEGATGRTYRIASRKNISFDQLCEWAGIAYELNLMSVDDPDELNAIDRLFAERVAALSRFFAPSSESPLRKDCECVSLESRFMEEKFAIAELRKIRRRQAAEMDRDLARAAALSAELRPTTVHVNEGELTYFTAGFHGTPVVMINALGQGLRYWSRLMSELSQEHKVVIWEPRGTGSAPHPFSIADQVNDLNAILSHEGIESCHLIAWCTGPKVAIEFYLRRPEAVASMVLLNGAYKCPTTPSTLISEYENNLEGLFRALDSSPTMASVIRNALLQSAVDSEIPSPSEMDGKELASRVLLLKSRDLQTEVLKPFESELSTLNYARQVLEFYSCDVGPKAPKVEVPVLLIGGEYDQIASPALSRHLAQSLPSSRYVEMRGATHYCLYEQSGRVCGLIQEFFSELENSGKLPPVQQAAYAGEFSKRA